MSDLIRISSRVLIIVFLVLGPGACGALESEPAVKAAAAVETPTATAIELPTDDPQKAVETNQPKDAATVLPEATAFESTVQAPGDDGSGSVVRIEAVGTFEALWQGLPYVGSGFGSGFLISEDGFILTHAHVVLGAALLRVFVPGDTNPISGRVVATDECSDVALVKVEGSDFPVLEFARGVPEVDGAVRALGYAYGATTMGETVGSVIDIDGSGASDWAALAHTIQHSAEIHPGNSGGPLLDANNLVVGINYAGDSAGGAWAVPISLVTPIISQMRTGSVEAFGTGINGQAFVSQVSDVRGVFVSSVATGSVAASAGIRAGDLLMELERLPLAQDGTLRDYCDILRSHVQTDVLEVRVYRRAEHTVLVGELNGAPLAQVQGALPEPVPPRAAPVYYPAAEVMGLIDAGMRDIDTIASDLDQDAQQQVVGVDDLREQPISFSWVWCAATAEQLEQNLEHFTVMFVVDGISYSEDAIFRENREQIIDVAGSDVSAHCSESRIGLDQWDSGVHRAVVSAYLDTEISDGWYTYLEDYVHEKIYEIRVN